MPPYATAALAFAAGLMAGWFCDIIIYILSRLRWRFFTKIASGILFALLYLRFGLCAELVFYCVFICLLLIIAMIDLKYMVIHDAATAALGVLALIMVFALRLPLKEHILGAVFGFSVFFCVYWIARVIYKREAFGLGDVFLMCAAGLFLGFKNAALALILSFYIALAAIIILKVFKVKLKRSQEIPFGPFICAGACAALFFGQSIIDFYFGLI